MGVLYDFIKYQNENTFKLSEVSDIKIFVQNLTGDSRVSPELATNIAKKVVAEIELCANR